MSCCRAGTCCLSYLQCLCSTLTGASVLSIAEVKDSVGCLKEGPSVSSHTEAEGVASEGQVGHEKGNI
jgi:hypothetical protein